MLVHYFFMPISNSHKQQIESDLKTYNSAFRLPQLNEKDFYAAEEFLDHVSYRLSILNTPVVYLNMPVIDHDEAPATVREIAQHFDFHSLIYSIIFENEKMHSYSVWTLINNFSDEDAEFLKGHVVDGFYNIKPLKAGSWMLLAVNVDSYGGFKYRNNFNNP